ncbi:MAG: universal stress protein [Winogradskyella sp.]|uniref:universal stress protein n=1 Tax=Winogradskyella sp. TaxID=1883156 RepID=UPI0017D1EA07|nr:universal stress protein [Winogradskyella sp.]
MKNILLLTDFSKTSINAIHYAIRLFKDTSCAFYLLHVKSSASYATDDLMAAGNESIYSSIVKGSKDDLDTIVIDIKRKFKKETLVFETLVDYDGFTDSIKQTIEKKAIDLVVMGTNGVTGAKEVVFGSNTTNVIRTINCPILAVPEGFNFRTTNDILFPLDAADSLSGQAFEKAAQFAINFSQKIHILRINPDSKNPTDEHKDQKHLNAYIKTIDTKYHVVNNVPMNYAVDCYLQTHQIDLMLLLVQPEHFLERFFTSSATTKISNTIRVPLLVFHSA